MRRWITEIIPDRAKFGPVAYLRGFCDLAKGRHSAEGESAVCNSYVGETSTPLIVKNFGTGGEPSCEQSMDKCPAIKQQSAAYMLGDELINV
ncbi:MAG: hypothetical protein WCB14_14890, partial [Candidatus Acidiferrales bacterium]